MKILIRRTFLFNFMSDNCPVGCPLCLADAAEESGLRADEAERMAEDDANFADQDL